MSTFDEYKQFDHWATPNIGAVMSTFKAMHAETPGSDEHADLLEAFANAAAPMTPFERTLFERTPSAGLRSKYLKGLPTHE